MESVEFLFFLYGLILIFPVFFFSSAFLKISIFIYFYPVWVLLGLYLGIPATRIIRSVGLVYYQDYIGYAFWSAFLSYIFFLIPLWSIRRSDFSFYRIPFSLTQRLFLFFFFILILPIAYPAAIGVGDVRFGSLGSIVVVLMSLLVISARRKYDVLNIVLFCIMLFMVVRGERVDFILTLAVILFIANKSSKINVYKLSVLLLIFLVLGIFGGVKRSGLTIGLDDLIELIGFAIVNFGTAIDVVHVYLSSTWYYYQFSSDFRPFINLLSSYVPLIPYGGVSSEYNFVWILRNEIANVGGGTFYVVAMMLFGPIGVIVFGFLYGVILKFLFNAQHYYAPVFIAFFIMQFRVQWYGATYFGSVFFVLTFFWGILKILNRYGYIKAK